MIIVTQILNLAATGCLFSNSSTFFLRNNIFINNFINARIYVSSLSGAQIPLSQLARIEFENSPTQKVF